MNRLKVAVVGATGLAGQQFLAALAHHPRYEVARLAASARSAGKTYKDALRDASGALRWYCAEPLSDEHAALPVVDAAAMSTDGLAVVFTALESDAAKELEPLYARDVPVLSTASAFRYESDVPILLPGVNADHAKLIEVQRRRRGWKGFIVPGPNCTTVGLAITLKPLAEAFGVKRVLMTSLQSVSGAGRTPGVMALDIVDNVIPYISKEEEKVQLETKKILGQLGDDGQIKPHAAPVSCTCTRVPVLEGHTESVFVELGRSTTAEEIVAAWRAFGRELHAAGHPSAPEHMILVNEDPYRPQPRLDRDAEGGMATTVGRLRKDDALDNGWKYVLVSHNTRMGAAKGAILMAEILEGQGLIA
jgi:aspartate-semialdehyde dehydrogenase